MPATPKATDSAGFPPRTGMTSTQTPGVPPVGPLTRPEIEPGMKVRILTVGPVTVRPMTWLGVGRGWLARTGLVAVGEQDEPGLEVLRRDRIEQRGPQRGDPELQRVRNPLRELLEVHVVLNVIPDQPAPPARTRVPRSSTAPVGIPDSR